VRYRLMATYQGSPFEVGLGPTQGDVVLFAACPPPEDLGFEPATGHWRKQLKVTDVQAVWESRPVGVFRGERCMVLDDLGDRLHIGYLGHDGFKAEELGYWQVDRGVFELVAPRSEVTEILEERTEYPRPAATPRPDAGQQPVPGSYSPGSTAQHSIPAAYMRLADSGTGIAMPVAAPAPLPLEAEALRAASAARRPPADRSADLAGPATRQPENPVAAPPANGPDAATSPSPTAARLKRALAQAMPRRSGRTRLATERIFADLAARAGIPAESYALGEVIEGALCVVQTEHGFEVFHAAASSRQELQTFPTEEAACFYLFGVLAAEAVRNGSLTRATAGLGAGSPQQPD
jgi:hypothetical protein